MHTIYVPLGGNLFWELSSVPGEQLKRNILEWTGFTQYGNPTDFLTRAQRNRKVTYLGSKTNTFLTHSSNHAPGRPRDPVPAFMADGENVNIGVEETIDIT